MVTYKLIGWWSGRQRLSSQVIASCFLTLIIFWCLCLLNTLPLPLSHPNGRNRLPLHLLLLLVPWCPPSSLPFWCTQSQLSLTTTSFLFSISSISFGPIGSSTGTISLLTPSPPRRMMRAIIPGWTFSPPFTHTLSSVPKHCCLPSALWLRGKSHVCLSFGGSRWIWTQTWVLLDCT